MALTGDSLTPSNSDGVNLNLNVSVNKTVEENSSQDTEDIVSKVASHASETADGNEINLDVDIEVSIENSHSVCSSVDRALPSPQQQLQQIQQQPQQEEDDEIADTVMVNQMINDIARRRAQRMVRSKSSFSVDPNDPILSPATSLQHLMDTMTTPATIPEVEEKPKESFAKRLKDKISNRFTRQSFDKSQSIDLNNNENIEINDENLAHKPSPQQTVNHVKVQQRPSSGKQTPIPHSQSSRSMYDSGIEQTPNDLVISKEALDYNKEEDEFPTPGIYKYSEEYPTVKLRDKSVRRRDYHKSRGSSLSESKAKRLSFHSSVDFSDHDSKRKSGMRYKRSSSKVKIARERSIDKDRFSRDHSLDHSSSKRNSLRRQKSHREDESSTGKRRSLSRDKSLSREKSFSREDSAGNRASLLKKRKSFDRQKSMDRGQHTPDTQRKFKSHKNKFLEELDLAKKKALIKMLKDNKLNMTKELHKKNICLLYTSPSPRDS